MNSKTLTVEIVKESAKGALLVKAADGRTAWLLPKSVKDGQVNLATFEKKAQAVAEKQTASAEVEAFKNSYHSVTFCQETEKACKTHGYGYRCLDMHDDLDVDFCEAVWIPKSQIVDGKVPGWLILAKARDLRAMNPAIRALNIGGVNV